MAKCFQRQVAAHICKSIDFTQFMIKPAVLLAAFIALIRCLSPRLTTPIISFSSLCLRAASEATKRSTVKFRLQHAYTLLRTLIKNQKSADYLFHTDLFNQNNQKR